MKIRFSKIFILFMFTAVLFSINFAEVFEEIVAVVKSSSIRN
jgi:hypothetical protein